MIFPRIANGNYRRPTQDVCTEFGGILRRPIGVLGRWWDDRNLTAARYPRMAVRPVRTRVDKLDDNEVTAPLAAICDGADHPVLMDRAYTYYCNGHKVTLTPHYGFGNSHGLQYSLTVVAGSTQANVTLTPSSGIDDTFGMFGRIGLDPDHDIVTQSPVTIRCVDEQLNQWECNLGGTWTPCESPAKYGINIEADNWIDGLEITLTQQVVSLQPIRPGQRLIRMGALIIDPIQREWVNAIDLAAGTTMVEGTNYGSLEVNIGRSSQTAFTLTMCDIDGNAYSGVVVSSTAPSTQSGYWLDTSGSDPELKQWSSSQTMWVSVSSTYVRLAKYGDIKIGDTVHLALTGMADDTDQTVVSLLNGDHYIYNIVAGQGSSKDLIIAGILPAETVTVSPAPDATLRLVYQRKLPDMDFVVECGNRLWGCRYSEADSINEIYASKLGDPTNWSVFQGLATDSWRASRGKAAPFTGAAVLDGCPLFFREDSVEKVYPSASGAHTVRTYDIPGIAAGSADSAVVIDGTLYYHGRNGIYRYNGTVPVLISDALGDVRFKDASAARHKRTYCVAMTDSNNNRVVGAYNLDSGDWHYESDGWTGYAATIGDDLYYTAKGLLYTMAGENSKGVEWYAETGTITYVPVHKWITYLCIRARLEHDAECRVYIKYDGGRWERKGRLYGNCLRSRELVIWPRRCDSFRLRIEGKGGCEIQSISYKVARGER